MAEYDCPVCRETTPHISGLMGGMSACEKCRTLFYCVWEREDERRRLALATPTKA